MYYQSSVNEAAAWSGKFRSADGLADAVVGFTRPA
jgi:hypothetical protein